jgi:two-component system, NtrC family, sensor histidine kinase GlrK
MRFSIFWRVILAQSALTALVLGLSLYAMMELNSLARLSSSIVAVDSDCIRQEKGLLKIFLEQMRAAKKFMIMNDQVFYDAFKQGNEDFSAALNRIAALVDTQDERDLLESIRSLHSGYVQQFELSVAATWLWEQTSGLVSEGILKATDELIKLREDMTIVKARQARDQAQFAGGIMAWLGLGGVAAAILLAYFNARSVTRPLKELAKEMRHVGEGEFNRSLNIKAPPEVQRLADDFNWMAARLEELDQMKADFISNVSHELRTPLTAMREGTALLLEGIPGPLSPSQREILEVLSSNSDRLFRSICSILDLSKMNAGLMEYQLFPCDLRLLINKSISSVQLIARKRGISLVTDLPENPPMLLVDEGKIEQVLDNLLSNALKFTPEGGKVAVEASIKTEPDNSQLIEVRVSDSGQGIAREDCERVFERFFQGSHSGKSRQGTGLGLAVAQHVVRDHHGRIWVESELGKGSTFIFTLPIIELTGHLQTEAQL